MAVDSGDERGQQDPDEFEHAGGIADHKVVAAPSAAFAPYRMNVIFGKLGLGDEPDMHRRVAAVIAYPRQPREQQQQPA